MSIKLHSNATLEMSERDVCRLLTEALCDFISPFDKMEVWRMTRTKHGKLRLDMMPVAPKVRPAPPLVVDKVA